MSFSFAYISYTVCLLESKQVPVLVISKMNLLQLLGSKLMVLSQLFSVLFPVMFAVDPNCNYYQNMVAGTTYYVYNKEYPSYYGPNQNCLWIAVAPAGYIVEAICQLEMPNSGGCQDDRLLISRTGNPELGDADVFCGFGNKTIRTESSSISIGLQTSWNSSGGRFLCSIEAKSSPPPQCDCGWKNMRRIVGGVETKVNEFPMMAGLVDVVKRDVFCGATIIASRYVLTAAHCLVAKAVDTTAVLIGEHDTSTGAETNATSLLRAARFIIHPNYNATSKTFDIGIVHTQTVIQYSWAVGPVCLPFAYYQQSFAGANVEALGWGTTEFTGPTSDKLLKTDLTVLDYQRCYSDVKGNIDQLCTYREGHDACQKDSGGPVLWFDSNTYRVYLVGVISYGFGCATQTPAVNTRVTSYLMWIISVTRDAEYCNKGPN